MDLEKKVGAYIARHCLLDKDRKHIVALSGGADSVALLLVLLNLGYDIEAAHCNFHLRGAESDRDERFVCSLCSAKNVPLHLVHFDTNEYAALHKVSIEMAARQLRYGYFEQLRRDIGAAGICVAHHRDDNVETVIMNLVRGTGMRGLAGIHPVNGSIIRPLLCVCRQEIEQYLTSIGQAYVTDSSNLVDDVVRNKLRLNIIPQLKDINPAISDNIQRTTEHITDALKILDVAVSNAILRVSEPTENGGIAISIKRLCEETASEYLLYEILKEYGFTPAQVEPVYMSMSAPAGQLFSAAEYDLLVDRGQILIEHKEASMKPTRIIEYGTYVLPGDHRIKLELKTITADFVVSRVPNIVCLDAESIGFPLTLRPIIQGDRFVPFGMKGTKLVSDYLTDRKKNLFQKRRQLILTDVSENIIWLVNERPDNRYRITRHSRQALIISWIE